MAKRTGKKEPNHNFMLTVILIFMIMLTVGIIYIERENKNRINELKNIVENSNTESNDTTETEEETITQNSTIIKQNPTTCSGIIEGTYYGEYSGQIGNFSLTEKQTITLNSDGTYTRSYVNGEITSGTYMITDGILTITYIPMGAPSTYSTTETLSISSDCSTIAIKGDSYNYNLIKQ